MLALALALVVAQTDVDFRDQLGRGFKTPGAGGSFFSFLTNTITASQQCTGAALTSDQGATIGFTRASTRYCTKADGTLVLLTTGQPAVNGDGLSIEGTHTNITLRSQELDNTTSAWTHDGVTVTANNIAAPDGTTTAERISTGVASAQHRIFANGTVTSGTQTLSVYAKPGSGAWVRLYSASTINALCTFNLSAGVVGTTGTGATCRIEALASGWFRIVMVYTGDGSSTQRVILKTGDSEANSAAGVAWSGTDLTYYFWGAQQEAGGLTSYIPTTTASVARPDEVATFGPARDASAIGCVAATVTYGLYPGAGRVVGFAGAEGLLSASATTASIHDGANTTTKTTALSMANRSTALRAYWSAASMMALIDGAETTAGTFDGNMNAATVYLGSQAGTSNFLFGSIKNLRLGTSASGCQ